MSTFVLIVIGLLGFYLISRHIDKKEQSEKEDQFKNRFK
jgi:hypothetical protein